MHLKKRQSTVVSLAGAATSIISDETIILARRTHVLVATKYVFCRDKSMLVATNKSLKIILLLSGQTRFCRDKTRLLSRQKYACRDKTHVCRDKKHNFVAAEVLKHLLVARNYIKLYLWQLPPMSLSDCVRICHPRQVQSV